jgi:hypothetical protein
MEMNKKRSYGGLKALLYLAISGLVVMPFISSCGKGPGTSGATALNIRYQVVNVSPDAGPISLYIDFQQYNGLNFFYPQAAGYFVLNNIDTPFQVRSSPIQLTGSIVSSQIYVQDVNTVLHPNFKYTLFVYGFKADTLKHLILTDTSATAPPLGYGKVRIVNLSPSSGSFDIYANGTSSTQLKNLQFGHVSPYVQIPAGNYTFQFYPAGTNVSNNTAGAVGAYQNLTVLDGRLFTLYTYGVVGHTTDTLAFGVHGIAN